MHLIWLLSPVLNLVVAVLRDSVGIRYIIAVLHDRLLSGRALCLNIIKKIIIIIIIITTDTVVVSQLLDIIYLINFLYFYLLMNYVSSLYYILDFKSH